MNGYDLDNPLALDVCELCGLEAIGGCVCDPARPYRVPTPEEIECSRAERLVRAETETAPGSVAKLAAPPPSQAAEAHGEHENGKQRNTVR